MLRPLQFSIAIGCNFEFHSPAIFNYIQVQLSRYYANGEVLPNQVGKPVENPTLKWIAELMNMIAVVTIDTEDKRLRIVTNVKKVHQRIITYFGQHALHIYGLSPELKKVDINHANYKNLLHWCEM